MTLVRAALAGTLRQVRVRSAVLALSLLLVAAGSASAVPPTVAISSTGPLTNVWIGNELSCQISYAGDTVYELYPSSAVPGDCGTFLAVGGALFAPDLVNHTSTAARGFLGTYTPFTPVSQTPVTGTGSGASPFSVTTVATAGSTGLQVRQIDRYVVGQESYRTDLTVTNTGGAAQSVILYRAGDCYLQGTDRGYGFLGPTPGAVGCSANANNTPSGRIEQWLPITGGNTWLESTYSNVWSAIGAQMPFANTCMCTEIIDNGAGIAWALTIPPGGSATVSHYTTFSPSGNSAPPPPPGSTGPNGPPTAFGRNGIIQGLPSNKVCLSKRHFRIHIRRYPGITYVEAIVFVNHHTVSVTKSRAGQFSAPIDLRGLPSGTFPVKITVITSTGSIISGTRTYKTCRRKQGFHGNGRL
jgi:hypothetical protein